MAKKKRKKGAQKPKMTIRGTPTSSPNGDDGNLESAVKASQEADSNQAEASTAQPPTQKSQIPQSASNTGAAPSGFLQGTKEELEKVVWPDRQQLISESAAVILMVSLSATLISLIDNLFGWISQLVF